MTVEAAVAAPVFAACMIAVLIFVNVYGCAAVFSSALTQTAEEEAVAAFTSEYGAFDSPVDAVLSAGYAAARIHAVGGPRDCVRGENLLLSSFLETEDRIDLVLTYKVQSPSGLIRIPGLFFVQRACVRGWVGRDGSGNADSAAETDGDSPETVYVTEHGTVYHTDRTCTHIKLSVRRVSMEEAEHARNASGAKYHACELCGGGSGMVYITGEGNRYHSSVTCSGLKRTIREVSFDEIGELRPCSKCAQGG